MTKEDFIKKARLVHGDKYDYSKTIYINIRTKIKIICPIHGPFIQIASSHITHKQNCPICAKTKLNTITLVERFIKTHGDKYDYSLVNYVGRDCHVMIICKTHGVFTQRHDVHTKGYGCPSCKSSLGEKEISDYLNEKNINYYRQKRFKDCRFKKELPFDFYLPEYNTCIEYHGKQHYCVVEYWDGINGLKLRQKRDDIKMRYCEKNNISLIIIKYDDDIEKVLNNLI